VVKTSEKRNWSRNADRVSDNSPMEVSSSSSGYYLKNLCGKKLKSKPLHPLVLGLLDERMLLLIKKRSNAFLAVLAHTCDDVYIDTGFDCFVKRHTIHLIKQSFRQCDSGFAEC
jgi:hypothetical protein